MNGKHSFDACPSTPVPADNMSRMPQYNAANESASEKGHASSEPTLHKVPRPATFNAAPSTSVTTALAPSTETDDTIGAGWDHCSETSARPASASASASTHDANNALTPDIFLPDVLDLDLAVAVMSSSELSFANMNVHNIMTNLNPFNERLMLLTRDQSTIVSSGLFPELSSSHTRASVHSKGELGESLVPVAEISALFGIGHWADGPRPHMT